MTEASHVLEMWAVVELLGHRRLAGFVTEEEHFGTKLIRLDIPGENDTFTTQYYSASALYCLTPTTEDLARAIAARSQPAPVQQWELPAPKVPAAVAVAATGYTEDIE